MPDIINTLNILDIKISLCKDPNPCTKITEYKEPNLVLCFFTYIYFSYIYIYIYNCLLAIAGQILGTVGNRRIK